MRPFQNNCRIFESLIWTPESIRSTLSLSGCLVKIIAPMTETIPWISSLQICSNATSTTVRYTEYNSSSPSMLSLHFFNSRMPSHTLGSTLRKLATIVAHIKMPVARETRWSRAPLIHASPFPIDSSHDLRNMWMSWKVGSSGLTLLPEGISIWMLMDSGNIRWMNLSYQLVMTSLNLFKWSMWVQRLSVHRRPLWLSFPDESCLRPLHSSGTSITITGSSPCGMLLSVNNGISIRHLNLLSMLDRSGILLFWTMSRMCWHTEGYRQARPRAMTHQSASVVMVADFVRSKRNNIIWRSCFCSQAVILAANADFPTPGDSLIQITLCLSTLSIPFSISCKMDLRVPSIYGLRRKSLFSPRAQTKLSQTSFGHISINSPSILTFSMATESPWKDLSIDTSHVSRRSVMAEILGRSTGNHHGTVY